MYSIKPLEFKLDSIILLYFFFIIVNILLSCFSITIIDKLSLFFCVTNTHLVARSVYLTSTLKSSSYTCDSEFCLFWHCLWGDSCIEYQVLQ